MGEDPDFITGLLQGVQTIGGYTGIPALAAVAAIALKLRGGSRAEPKVARLERRVARLEGWLMALGLERLLEDRDES